MGAQTQMVGPKRRWGTWEELILGGAVLRHGTQNWDVVASELRARTIYPYRFSPEVCKSKYEDLQQRYSGGTAWFEELRKRRVAELKRELEKSEDSIGSLESKLESLKAEKGHYSQVNFSSSQIESPEPLPKLKGIESSGKVTSKDGLSAGSFTKDAQTNWLNECHIPAVASSAETETRPEISESCEQEKVLSIKKLAETSNEKGGTVRKRRGKRKRKYCNTEAKEGSIGESDNLGSTNVVTASDCKENSTSDCGQTVRSSGLDDHNRGLCRMESDDLMGIFNSVAENENALVFRHRLDSQKRARYRNIIRRHMDLVTIRSRIDSCSIKSVKELFRDLLLLANNALVFYSRRTREYKSALSLRDLVTKAYRQHYKDSSNKAYSAILSISPMCNPPVKPRSVRPRPFKCKFSAKLPNTENVVTGIPQRYKKLSNADSTLSLQSLLMAKKGAWTPQGYKKLSNDDSSLSLQSLVMGKKGFSRPGKFGRGTANQRPKTPMKERKRAQQR